MICNRTPSVDSMIVVSRDKQRFLARVLEQGRRDEVTYGERGRTRSATLPSGYHHVRVTVGVGHDEEDWSRAQDAVRRWRAHEGARITVTPDQAPIEEGATVLASRSFGPVVVVAPCRIVYTTVTATRFGFAYGTLPGHPEQGEEAFHVQVNEDGIVAVEIVAFSRPADLPTRLGGPLARLIQGAATKRYIEGIRAYVGGGQPNR
jgi:uncharacterized protein (UPF0548 family)